MLTNLRILSSISILCSILVELEIGVDGVFVEGGKPKNQKTDKS